MRLFPLFNVILVNLEVNSFNFLGRFDFDSSQKLFEIVENSSGRFQELGQTWIAWHVFGKIGQLMVKKIITILHQTVYSDFAFFPPKCSSLFKFLQSSIVSIMLSHFFVSFRNIATTWYTNNKIIESFNSDIKLLFNLQVQVYVYNKNSFWISCFTVCLIRFSLPGLPG